MNYPKNLLKIALSLIAGMIFIFSANGQNSTKIWGANYQNTSWNTFVIQVEKAHPVRLFYDDTDIPDFQMDLPTDSVSLEKVLNDNLASKHLTVSSDHNRNFFLIKNAKIVTTLPDDFFQLTKVDTALRSALSTNDTDQQAFLPTQQAPTLEAITIGSIDEGRNQSMVNLNGMLKSKEDGTAIVGVTVAIEELEKGTYSNELGFYSFKLPKGTYTLLVRSLNYKEERKKITLLSSGRFDIELSPKLVELEGVNLTADRNNNVQNTQMGYDRLTIARVKEIPLVLGEQDILKVAQLLPGIQSVGEGTAGFNVRGSPADQNLFYINEVPIYNTSHLFGFFSAFNSDAISEFALSKSNIPAKFGGRLASIFEVTAKQGNRNKFAASGGISPITGRLMIEGPIQKEKSSFMIGGRSTYSNWILRQIKDPDFANTSARFADGVANLSFDLSQNDQLQVFSYYSFDDINFAANTQFDYENLGGSASWRHFFNQKHNLDMSVVYSKYGLNVSNQESVLDAYQQSNALEHKEAKASLTLRPNKDHQISFGANGILYEVDRGSFLPFNQESQIDPKILGNEKGFEGGVYLSDQWDVSQVLSIIGGLRFNLYRYLGPQTLLEYRENFPLNPENVVDTLTFGNNENIRTSTGLDYRLAAKYMLTPELALKASYNKLHQYIFLLSNTIALAPSDKWKLSDYHIDPMIGEQISLGMYANLRRNTLELSVEGYYKETQNLVEFRDGADLLVNEIPEQDILQGDLTTFGIEVMLKKPFGKFNGWLNYTFSQTRVLVDGEQPSEKINFGQAYPANYDKPHSVNLVGSYKFNRRISVSGNMVYSTGRPITYPTTIYYQNDIQLINFSSRNEYRIPDYVRFDLSVKFEGNLRADKLFHGNWVFSMYNLLGRDNVYSAYFTSTDRGISGYKVSIFGSPIFSASYNVKLGNYAN